MPTEIQSTPVTEPLRPGLGRFLIVLAMAQGGQEPITAAYLNNSFQAAVREVVEEHSHAVGTHIDPFSEKLDAVRVERVVWKDQR